MIFCSLSYLIPSIGIDVSKYWILCRWPQTLAAIRASPYPHQRHYGERIMLPHSVTIPPPSQPLIDIVYQLEIVGVRSVAHLSCVTVCHIAALPLLQVGSAFSLAVVIIFNVFQASSIELKFKPPASATSFSASFQIDGEPFTYPIGRIFIPHNLANVLIFSQMEE
jgi:hypothetical protein